MFETILALGSNIGNRENNIEEALSRLEATNNIKIIKKSSNYYSNALLPENAKEDWDKEFLNICVYAKTNLDPYKLLAFIKQIEQDMGRGKYDKWSPRIIDIDIILYDNITLESDNLIIPHKEYRNRDFVMIPLKEVIGYSNLEIQPK